MRYASNSGAALTSGPKRHTRAEFFDVPRLFVIGRPFWQVWTIRVSGCRETHPVGRHDVRELAVNRLPRAVTSVLGSENVGQFRAVECSDLNRVQPVPPG